MFPDKQIKMLLIQCYLPPLAVFCLYLFMPVCDTCMPEDGWSVNSGACYFLSADRKSFTEAANACSNRLSTLLTITSQTEQEYIELLLAAVSEEVLIGLNYDSTSAAHIWHDGYPVSYTNWKPGSAESGNCVFIKAENQQRWAKGECNSQRKYICKMDDAFSKQGNLASSASVEAAQASIKDNNPTTCVIAQSEVFWTVTLDAKYHLAAVKLKLGYGDGSFIVLYESASKGGMYVDVTSDAPNLSFLGLDNKMSSFEIHGTYPWQLCSDTNYGGTCSTFSPGFHDKADIINSVGDDAVSSVRRAPPATSITVMTWSNELTSKLCGTISSVPVQGDVVIYCTEQYSYTTAIYISALISAGTAAIGICEIDVRGTSSMGRFAPGGKTSEGRAQMWKDGHFSDICHANLDSGQNWPDEFCQGLGYSAGAFATGYMGETSYSSGETGYRLRELDCTAAEGGDWYSSCSVSSDPAACDSSKDVAVSCIFTRKINSECSALSVGSCEAAVTSTLCDFDLEKCVCDTDLMPSVDLTQCVASCEGLTGLCEAFIVRSQCDSGQCACPAAYSLNEPSMSCDLDFTVLGSTCADNLDCSEVDHSTCTTGLVCECTTGYAANSENSACLAGSLGSVCTSAEDVCSSVVPHSHCDSLVCGCIAGYISSGDSCMSAVIGTSCSSKPEACSAQVTGSHCDPTTGCACDSGLSANHDNTKCIHITLYTVCTGEPTLFCSTGISNSECSGGVCTCATKHYSTSGGATCERITLNTPCQGKGADFCSSSIPDSYCAQKCTCSGGLVPALGDNTRCVVSSSSKVGKTFLINNGPVKPGDNVTFVFFTEALGYLTTFTVKFGDGKSEILGRLTKSVSWEDYFFVLPTLPYSNINGVYRTIISHQYTVAQVYSAEVIASNKFGNIIAYSTVRVELSQCGSPEVAISGIGSNSSSIPVMQKSDTIVLVAEILSFSCEISGRSTFDWSFYLLSSTSDLPTEENKVVLGSKVKESGAILQVKKFALDAGLYFIKVKVTLVSGGRSYLAHQQAWLWIATSSLQVNIRGGSSRQFGRSQDVILDASATFDPEAPSSQEGIEYSWYCRPAGEVFPQTLQEMDAARTGGCMKKGYRLVYQTANITIPGSQLTIFSTYIFRVVVSKVGRETAHTEQTITLLAGNPPQLGITCSFNCQPSLNPSDKLALQSSCADCHQPVYRWTVLQGNMEYKVDWKSQTLTGNDKKNLVIKPAVFPVISDDTFSVRLQVTTKDGSIGQAMYKFQINKAPSLGQCEASPTEGVVLQTQFAVSCTGFEDTDQPLTYTFSHLTASYDNQEKRTLLYYGTASTMPESYLPVGDPEDGYTVTVEVTVADRFKAAVSTRVKIKVKEASVEMDSLDKLVSGENSALNQLLNAGNSQGVAQLVTAVSSVLNSHSKAEERGEETQNRTKLRDSLVDTLAGVDVHSLGGLQQTSSALVEVTKTTAELSPGARQVATAALASMSKFLVSQLDGDTSTAVKESGRLIVSGLSNILAASDQSNGTADVETGNTETIERSSGRRNVSLAAMGALEDVKMALLETKLVGEEPTLVSTSNLQLLLDRHSPEETATGFSLQDPENGTGGKVMVPPGLSMLQGRSQPVNAELVTFKDNPFSWADSSDEVKSSVTQFQLKADGLEVKVENLSSPIDLYVPQEKQNNHPKNITLHPAVRNFATVTVEKNNTGIQIYITARDKTKYEELVTSGNSTLTFYLSTLFGPNITNITEPEFMSQVDLRALAFGDTMPVLVLPSSAFNGTGDYVLMVDMNYTGSAERLALRSYLSTVESSCLFWNESQERWLGDGCQLGPYSTMELVHCQCTHLSAFGSSFFVMPNKLDLTYLMANFGAELSQNPVVLAFLCSVLALFVPIFVWARRKDLRDSSRNGVVDLVDNDPLASHRYFITVSTGSRRRAGTTANVTITLQGSEGDSAPHHLHSPEWRAHQWGQHDCFLLRTHQPLGDLKAIRLWHDNTGSDPTWYLSHVLVKDLETGAEFFFMCRCWLAVDIGDGLIDRTFPVATKKDIKQFNYLFTENSSRGLEDGHLWFSVLMRPSRSSFTRLQRVACCLSLLFTTMLTNIMFYRGSGEKPSFSVDQEFDLGVVEFSWSQVIIGIESSLLMFPINLLIIQIFRLSKLRPAKQAQGDGDDLHQNQGRAAPARQSSHVSESYKSLGSSLSRQSVQYWLQQSIMSLRSTGRKTEKSAYTFKTGPDSFHNMESAADKAENLIDTPGVEKNASKADQQLPDLYSGKGSHKERKRGSTLVSHRSLQTVDKPADSSVPPNTCGQTKYKPIRSAKFDNLLNSIQPKLGRISVLMQSLFPSVTNLTPIKEIQTQTGSSEKPAKLNLDERNSSPGKLYQYYFSTSSKSISVIEEGEEDKLTKRRPVAYARTSRSSFSSLTSSTHSSEPTKTQNNVSIKSLPPDIVSSGSRGSSLLSTYSEDMQRLPSVPEVDMPSSSGVPPYDQTANSNDKRNNVPLVPHVMVSEGAECTDPTVDDYVNPSGFLLYQELAQKGRLEEVPRGSTKTREKDKTGVAVTLPQIVVSPDACQSGEPPFYDVLVPDIVVSFTSKESGESCEKESTKHYFDSSVSRNSSLQSLHDEVKSRMKKKLRLPWWMVIVGWILLVCTTGVSGFFTLLYGLQYGREKSLEWLASMLISVFQDVLLLQPIKVIGLAFFFSLLLRKPPEDDTDLDLEQIPEGPVVKETDESKLVTLREQVQEQRNKPLYHPPPITAILTAREVREHERRLISIGREVAGYVVFIWLLLLVAYGQRDQQTYQLNSRVAAILFPDLQISSYDGLWEWLNSTVVPGMYDEDDPGFFSNKASYLLGSPRLRQLRLREENRTKQQTHDPFRIHFGDLPKTEDDLEDTLRYKGSWQNALGESNATGLDAPIKDAWFYHPAYLTQASPYWGKLGIYSGAGYLAELGTDRGSAYRAIRLLHDQRWVDQHTAVLFLEANMYTPSINLLTLVTGVVEKPSYSGFYVSTQIQSMRLYRYTMNLFAFVLACEILYVVYTLYFTVVQVLAIRKERWSYFKSVWNILELVIIHTSLAAIVTYALHAVEVNRVLNTYRNNRQRFISFQNSVTLDTSLVYLIAFLVMLATLKFIHMLRFYPRIQIFVDTLRHVKHVLSAFGLFFLILFLSVGILMHLAYGYTLAEYLSFPTSLLSVYLALLKKYNMSALQEANRILAPLIILSFSFCSYFFLFSLLMAILMNSFDYVRKNRVPTKDDELVALAVVRFKEWISWKDTHSQQT